VTEIEPFRIAVPQEELDDLRLRLRRTRWPTEIPESGWERGVPIEYLRELVDYWVNSYDWRVWEARLNALPQFTTVIDRQRIHFLHVRSAEPDALPLVVTHGWPGSIVETLEAVGPLTDPAGHGGDVADAFDLVAPSLSGFGFATPASEPGWNHHRIARAWVELMRRLGYQRYGAHGGDTGFVVSPEIGRIAPAQVVGVHIYGGLEFDSLTQPMTSTSPMPNGHGWRRSSGCAATPQGTPPFSPPARRPLATRSPTPPLASWHGSWTSSTTGPTGPGRYPIRPLTVTIC